MNDTTTSIEDNDFNEQSFNAVIDGMLNIHNDEIKSAFKSVSSIPAFEIAREQINKRNTKNFYYLFLHPTERPLQGFLESEMPGNYRAQFLFQHGQFIEKHYKNLFQRIEGSFCCADKSRAIMRGLARFLLDGEEIVFDYNQEYTYHLPKKIFNNHKSIVDFFESIYALYYGQIDKFILEISNIIGSAKP